MAKDEELIVEDFDIDFHEYQEELKKDKETKRNRRILISLLIVVYILGFGFFTNIILNLYKLNNKVGIIAGISILILYTIFYLYLVIGIYKKAAFDIRLDKNKRNSEKKNNKIRWDVARNIVDLEAKVNGIYLKKKDDVNEFEQLRLLIEKYQKKTPSYKNQDSITLCELLANFIKKNGLIYKKAHKMIIRNAVICGSMTAVSQDKVVDSGIVAVKNIQMIHDLIYLYGFRPTDKEMNRIIIKVIKNVCVAFGLSSLKPSNIAGKFFSKDSSNFIVGLVGSALDLGTELVGNSIMSYNIGKYTIKVMLKEFKLQQALAKYIQQEDLEMSSKVKDFKEEVKLLKNEEEE